MEPMSFLQGSNLIIRVGTHLWRARYSLKVHLSHLGLPPSTTTKSTWQGDERSMRAEQSRRACSSDRLISFSRSVERDRSRSAADTYTTVSSGSGVSSDFAATTGEAKSRLAVMAKRGALWGIVLLQFRSGVRARRGRPARVVSALASAAYDARFHRDGTSQVEVVR